MPSPHQEERAVTVSSWRTGNSFVNVPFKKRPFYFMRSPSPPHKLTTSVNAISADGFDRQLSNRSLWDLNTTMDSWEGQGSTADSILISGRDGTDNQRPGCKHQQASESKEYGDAHAPSWNFESLGDDASTKLSDALKFPVVDTNLNLNPSPEADQLNYCKDPADEANPKFELQDIPVFDEESKTEKPSEAKDVHCTSESVITAQEGERISARIGEEPKITKPTAKITRHSPEHRRLEKLDHRMIGDAGDSVDDGLAGQRIRRFQDQRSQREDGDRYRRSRSLWVNAVRSRPPPPPVDPLHGQSSQWVERERLMDHSTSSVYREDRDRTRRRPGSPRGMWEMQGQYDVEEDYDDEVGRVMRSRQMDRFRRRRSPSFEGGPASRMGPRSTGGIIDPADSPGRRSLSPPRPWGPLPRSPDSFGRRQVSPRGRPFEDEEGRAVGPGRRFGQQRTGRLFYPREEFAGRDGVDLRNRLRGGLRRRPADMGERNDFRRDGGPQGWRGPPRRERF